MNLLSLYSGIGALDLAAHWSGMNVVALCDSDPFCRSVLSRHWPEVPIFESDEDVSVESLLSRGVGRIDIIAGGPPCQPFSVAGKQAGVADPRHRWPQMARIVADVHPSWVVVENVGGFLDVAKPLVLPDLERLGYDAWAIQIPAAAVGAPAYLFADRGASPGGCMTLFDNVPLSEDEVRSRLLCECTHTYGTHRGGTNCTACECVEFVEVAV